jgi:hypothetical protein
MNPGSLNMLTLGAELLYNAQQAILVDGADSVRRQFQSDPLILFCQEELLRLKVRQKTTLGLNIRVGNLVTTDRRLTRNLTYSCHDFWKILECEGRGIMSDPGCLISDFFVNRFKINQILFADL